MLRLLQLTQAATKVTEPDHSRISACVSNTHSPDEYVSPHWKPQDVMWTRRTPGNQD